MPQYLVLLNNIKLSLRRWPCRNVFDFQRITELSKKHSFKRIRVQLKFLIGLVPPGFDKIQATVSTLIAMVIKPAY